MTYFYFAVHSLIDKNGKYLITRRSKKNDYMPLKWDIPGGLVEPGEQIDESLIREVTEETKLKIEIDRVIYIYTNLDQIPRKQTFQSIYLCNYISGNIQLNPDEHDKFEWVEKDDLKNFDSIAFLKDFIDSDIFSKIVSKKIPSKRREIDECTKTENASLSAFGKPTKRVNGGWID